MTTRNARRWIVGPALLAACGAPSVRASSSGDDGSRGAIAPATSEELPPKVYVERRARLLEKLGPDAVAILLSSPVRHRNGDVDYAYRQGSDFWYLTGFPEPESSVVITSEKGRPRCALFVPERDPGREIWDGPRLGTEGAKPLADEVRESGRFAASLKELVHGRKRILLLDGGDSARREQVAKSLEKPSELDPKLDQELRAAIGRMRLVKGPEELALLQRSIDITCEAERQVMRAARPGLHEYELQAIIEYVYTSSGCWRDGFPCIVGSGPNSCTLHYETNRREIGKDETIVVDIGAEYGGYSADVTRTLPSSGRFTPEEAAIYQAVLDAQNAGIAAVKPGATLAQVQGAALEKLGEALAQLGLAKDARAARRFCPHGTCHWLGLEVHDDCPYREEKGGGAVKLAPGMVTTVEPGCYVRAGDKEVDPKWWNIGVRIEDDVLVTNDGNVVMSASAPRGIAEIEALAAGTSTFPRAPFTKTVH